ncbi:MAG: hypothetical protein IPH81_12890 [Candidatus Microthrix sp.]|nr:hypothetical protein [Candidatus Microthrix sp.]
MINGEKWFTSAGRVADPPFAVNQRYVQSRNFETPRSRSCLELPGNHNHIIYNDVRIPADHLLDPEDMRQGVGPAPLGRRMIHHAMRTISQCKLGLT